MRFDKQVQQDLEGILRNKEPTFSAEFLGVDEASAKYPPHKAVRLVVLILLALTTLRFATLFLFVFSLAVLAWMSPLSGYVRFASTAMIAIVAVARFTLWVSEFVNPHAEYAYLYWRLHAKRRDFTDWELARINHSFYTRNVRLFVWISALLLWSLGVCALAFHRMWYWGAFCAIAIVIIWKCSQAMGHIYNKLVFDSALEKLGDRADEEAADAARFGFLPGDTTARSRYFENKITKRRLRLPALRLSFLLAYGTVITYLIGLSVVLPIVWYSERGWMRYTPIAQIVVLVSMAIMVKMIGVLKASDKRRFQTILLRPFNSGASSFAKNVILPVLGSMGNVITVEDRTLENAEVKSIPFSVRIDVVAGTDCVFPFVRGEDWKSEVIDLIAQSDAAVVDATGQSVSVDWEFEQCLLNLPIRRIVVVTEAKITAANKVKEHSVGGEQPHVLKYEDHFIGRIVFKWRMLQIFKQIRAAG